MPLFKSIDYIVRNGNMAIFVKVFEDADENCKQDELDKIRRAVRLENQYYESHVFIFSKLRFSDHAVAQAAMDRSISLVEVERLKW